MKGKILQVTLTLKGNNSSGTESKQIGDGALSYYESLQRGQWIVTKYSEKKGSVMCCCDPKASTLGIGQMSLGTHPSTWLWTCVCHHSDSMKAQGKATAVIKGLQSCHMNMNQYPQQRKAKAERDLDRSPQNVRLYEWDTISLNVILGTLAPSFFLGQISLGIL